MQETQQGITALEFIATPTIILIVALSIIFLVRKIKPDFTPKVSMPVFIFVCAALSLAMFIIVIKQIVIHGYR